ncbi:MAG: hypothetical protein J2O49_03720, partial [Sciscionella sp.]|nr:hypothetical protein [Sciscionella sp.]
MSSDMVQALLFSGTLTIYILLTQLGRRRYHLIRTVLPIALVGYFGWKYLHGLTLSTPTVLTAATGAAIGLIAGAVVL